MPHTILNISEEVLLSKEKLAGEINHGYCDESEGIYSPDCNLVQHFYFHYYPTHSAVQVGDVTLLAKLLEATDATEGDPFIQDFMGRTPLHYAANYGNQQIGLSMTTLLVNCKFIRSASFEDEFRTVVAKLIDVQDKNLETALHLAADNGHCAIVELLLSFPAGLNIKCVKGIEPIELIYANVPQVMCGMFDGAIRQHYGVVCDEGLEVEFNFEPIIGTPDKKEMRNNPLQMETRLLANVLKNSDSNSRDILLHPLVQVFLFFKWNKIRTLFWTSILLHILWSWITTMFLVGLYLHQCPYTIAHRDKSSMGVKCPEENLNKPLGNCAIVISILMGIKGIYKFKIVPTWKYYFKHLDNIGQLLFIVVVLITTSPVWPWEIIITNVDDGVNRVALIPPWIYQLAAVGVFLAWTLILGQIGKTPRLGIYVEILVKVLHSFGWFVLTFTSLLIAFALSFSILMPKKENFKTWPLALSNVLVMMTGELNYDSVFHNKDSTDDESMPFLLTGHIFFAIFTVIVTIILFNLLIGLTVRDIQSLQTKATASWLSKTLEQIFLMESFLYSKYLRRILNSLNLNVRPFRTFQVTSEGAEGEPNYRVKARTEILPKHLRRKVRELAAQNVEKSK